jgi:hypothetical protein
MQPFNMFGARSRLFMSNAQMSDWLALIQAITGDWLAIIGAITGLTMVIGSLLLLWFRKIALAKKGSEPEVILERANIFKLDIRNPALGLFILGISFICVSYWFYLHFGVSDKKVRIALEIDDPNHAVAHFMGDFGTDSPDGLTPLTGQV